jgi:hypothetical protein
LISADNQEIIMADTAPNPTDFSCDERPRDYTAIINVCGTIRVSIQADNKEDAQRQAEVEVERLEKDGYVEIDDIDTLEVDRTYKDPPMYRVTRDGKPMQVSRLEAGDTPRPPDAERGF